MSYISVALERKVETQVGLLRAYRHFKEHPIQRMYAKMSVEELTQWQTDVAILSKAETFYWNERTTKLVVESARDFDLTQINASRNLLYTDYGWHYFADQCPMSVDVPYENDVVRSTPIRAISSYWFSHRGESLGITAYVERNKELYPVLWVCVDGGAPMSSEVPKDVDFRGVVDGTTNLEMSNLKQLVCCMSTFVRQELLIAAPTQVERHARKRMEKVLPGNYSIVHEIQLRRAALSMRGPASLDEPEKRDWNWQWTVRGHVRKQWYRSLGEHLPVYIHPYVKGPEDKPLKPRTTPIYSVTR